MEAFDDLSAPEALELLARAPDPAAAARLTLRQISAALKRAGRYKVAERAERIQRALRGQQLTQPPVVADAYASAVAAQAAILAVLN
ncbi:hypothetical protein [Streptosporangium canum]|uniref:hypothetical protein n=1 Tax=Streptosporangium canum TaxID=324952 RepID=UPI00343CDF7C